MEIVELTRASAAMLEPLLKEQVESCDRILHWDYAASARLILDHVEARKLPGFAAIRDGRVAGYAFLMFEGSKGMVGDFYVESSGFTKAERRSLELTLICHCIDTLMNLPEVNRIEAQFLIHPAGTFVHTLVPRGFQRYRRVFLSRSPASCIPTVRPLSEEIEIRGWTDADIVPSGALIAAAYQAHVDNILGDRYRSAANSLEFLNSVVRFDGCGVFDAASSCVAFWRSSGERVGILLGSKLRHDVGHIVQLCTAPALRHKGIGEALVRFCAASQAARGMAELSLTVTEENARAVVFYERLGFQPFHRFDAFIWER
jgi:ribosomal protein S18 acetylase RimI-like enzyme